MTEMILPGTYITVRAEGLISAGRVATGIVGIVGTSSRGALNEAITLSGFSEARELFGLPDTYDKPEDGANPLTLVRSLEHIYNNGASTIIAVRVAGNASSADFAMRDDSDLLVATLTATTSGSWGNEISIKIEDAENDCQITDEKYDGSLDAPFTRLRYARVVPSARNRIRVYDGTTKIFRNRDLVYKRIIKEEEVVRASSAPYYQVANTPVENVGAINLITVVDSDGETVREYGLGSLLYDSVTPLDPGEANINTATGELTFGDAIAESETVIATYAAGHAEPQTGEILITTWDGSLQFAAGETPQQLNGDKLVASYLVDREDCVQVTLSHSVVTEAYTVPDGRLLASEINARSALVTAVADDSNGDHTPKINVNAFFGTGSNTPGANGADAGRDEYSAGLEALANKLVNIVVLAGQDAGVMGTVLEGHLNATENSNYERIGVIGAPGNELASYLGHNVANDRIVLVAPGMRYADGTTLPAAYTAAAVAGLISTLPVQTSLTNKTLTLPGVDQVFNQGQQAQLIKRNVLAVITKSAYRVLKGITSEGEGAPFSAIPTRRIVDYAKYGVRSAADPYIGRLNNVRVRSALQATLEAFLTRMIDDEALTAFDLEVTATRAQEIAGEVNVVMTLQPTFSIDFIKVTMNLK